MFNHQKNPCMVRSCYAYSTGKRKRRKKDSHWCGNYFSLWAAAPCPLLLRRTAPYMKKRMPHFYGPTSSSHAATNRWVSGGTINAHRENSIAARVHWFLCSKAAFVQAFWRMRQHVALVESEKKGDQVYLKMNIAQMNLWKRQIHRREHEKLFGQKKNETFRLKTLSPPWIPRPYIEGEKN